jgi:cytochrome c oxidase subunit 3
MSKPRLEPQFADLDHQGQTAALGLWVFIATEVLFFVALLFAYWTLRAAYWDAFTLAARDSKIALGAINQALLITSSLTMVLAIMFAKEGRRQALVRALGATALLGFLFLGVKGWEYWLDFADHTVPVLDFVLKPGATPPAEMFWFFYFAATGLHAVHLTIGVVLVLTMALRAQRGGIISTYTAPLEVVGLYWSFVDVVWFFLFAAIYPIGRAAS